MKEKTLYQSNYYEDLKIHKCNITHNLVQKFKENILKKETDKKILLWYDDLLNRDLEWFLISTLNNEPISGCGYGDGKVLRYLYKKRRLVCITSGISHNISTYSVSLNRSS